MLSISFCLSHVKYSLFSFFLQVLILNIKMDKRQHKIPTTKNILNIEGYIYIYIYHLHVRLSLKLICFVRHIVSVGSLMAVNVFAVNIVVDRCLSVLCSWCRYNMWMQQKLMNKLNLPQQRTFVFLFLYNRSPSSSSLFSVSMVDLSSRFSQCWP